MFYRSFFYECLVNLYFKKKIVLELFQGQKCPFKNTETFFVNLNTKDDLNNLCIIQTNIRFSSKFNIFFVKKTQEIEF